MSWEISKIRRFEARREKQVPACWLEQLDEDDYRQNGRTMSLGDDRRRFLSRVWLCCSARRRCAENNIYNDYHFANDSTAGEQVNSPTSENKTNVCSQLFGRTLLRTIFIARRHSHSAVCPSVRPSHSYAKMAKKISSKFFHHLAQLFWFSQSWSLLQNSDLVIEP